MLQDTGMQRNLLIWNRSTSTLGCILCILLLLYGSKFQGGKVHRNLIQGLVRSPPLSKGLHTTRHFNAKDANALLDMRDGKKRIILMENSGQRLLFDNKHNVKQEYSHKKLYFIIV